MEEKNQPEEQFCTNCGQKDQCREIYEKMGQSDAPSVVIKVITAFIAPILLFIAGIFVFENTLKRVIEHKNNRTFVAAVFALAACFIYVMIVSFIGKRRYRRTKNDRSGQKNNTTGQCDAR